MDIVSTKQEIDEILMQHELVLIYFSSPDCQVCHSLKPKVDTLVTTSFPKVHLVDVNVAVASELAASFSVFAAPTIVIMVEGRETVRWSRTISIDNVVAALERYTSLLGL